MPETSGVSVRELGLGLVLLAICACAPVGPSAAIPSSELAVAFPSMNGRDVVLAREGIARLFDVHAFREIWRRPFPHSNAVAVFSPSGEQLLLLDRASPLDSELTGTLLGVHAATGASFVSLALPKTVGDWYATEARDAFAVTDDAAYLARVVGRGTFEIDDPSGRIVARKEAFAEAVTRLVFEPSGHRLLVASITGRGAIVRLYQPEGSTFVEAAHWDDLRNPAFVRGGFVFTRARAPTTPPSVAPRADLVFADLQTTRTLFESTPELWVDEGNLNLRVSPDAAYVVYWNTDRAFLMRTADRRILFDRSDPRRGVGTCVTDAAFAPDRVVLLLTGSNDVLEVSLATGTVAPDAGYARGGHFEHGTWEASDHVVLAPLGGFVLVRVRGEPTYAYGLGH